MGLSLHHESRNGALGSWAKGSDQEGCAGGGCWEPSLGTCPTCPVASLFIPSPDFRKLEE